MLKNIKSTFFVKIIFSNIIEKRLLQIVAYNKSLQTKLGKNLINYKVLSGKYVIYETNKKEKYITLIIINYYLKENKKMVKKWKRKRIRYSKR